MPLLLVHPHATPLVFAVALAGTFLAAGSGSIPMSIIPAETVPRHAIATAVGLIMGVGEIIGGVVAPVLAGAAGDRWGAETPFYFAAGAAMLSAVLALFLVATAPARRRR